MYALAISALVPPWYYNSALGVRFQEDPLNSSARPSAQAMALVASRPCDSTKNPMLCCQNSSQRGDLGLMYLTHGCSDPLSSVLVWVMVRPRILVCLMKRALQ